MSIHPPCFICDALTPLYADMLCADHWLLRSVQALVRAGAWSEFDMDAWGKRPNHAAMLLTRDEQEATRRHAWQAVVVAACNAYSARHGVMVWWDDGTDDRADSEADRYTAMTGLIAAWVWQATARAMIERDKKRKGAA